VKTILIFAVAALPVFGQGTINFQTTLDGAHAIPPNSTGLGGWGVFALEPGNLFSAGASVVTVPNEISSVALFRATTPTEIGTHLFDLSFYSWSPGIAVEGQDSGPASVYFLNTPATLTPAQVSDLESGYWWVSVITPAFPNGEIRGQISTVPEPSTRTLVGLGAFALAGTRKWLRWVRSFRK
jgi:hypothetical protein